MKYKDITIEQAEILYNSNIQLVCDGDKQEIMFDDIVTDIINNIRDGLLKAFSTVIECAKEITKTIVQVYNNIKEYVVNIYNKKISKKKFIKLLQSYGVQRNDINKLIRNNKDRYTIQRVLLSIPHTFKRRSGKIF